MVGVRERLRKWTSSARAYRCEDCGTRQVSERKPARKERAVPQQVEESQRVRVRTAKRVDPLARKIALKREQKILITLVLVALTGIGAAYVVIKAQTHEAPPIREVD